MDCDCIYMILYVVINLLGPDGCHSAVYRIAFLPSDSDHTPRLVTGGVIIAGPPCSLHVAASQSVHQRSWKNLYGNTENMRVRLSNLLWVNFVNRLHKTLVSDVEVWSVEDFDGFCMFL